MLEKLGQNLLSKKLWITAGTAITLVANQQWAQLVILVLGYLGVQGSIDFKNK